LTSMPGAKSSSASMLVHSYCSYIRLVADPKPAALSYCFWGCCEQAGMIEEY